MPTIFGVTDIETTLKNRTPFDIAWQFVDRRGRVYGKGSYIVREAFQHDVPFFKEKLGFYFDDVHQGISVPASIYDVRKAYNDQIGELQAAGHKVILAAYNAAFDFKCLPEGLAVLTGGRSTRWLKHKGVQLLDIWDYWGQSVPLDYAKKAPTSESGRFVSTSAESAYQYEFRPENYKELHRAIFDVYDETAILLKALSRRKKMPLVDNPKQLRGAIWRDINTRLGIDGVARLPQAPELSAAAAA